MSTPGIRVALAELLIANDNIGPTVAYIERAKRLTGKPEWLALRRAIMAEVAGCGECSGSGITMSERGEFGVCRCAAGVEYTRQVTEAATIAAGLLAASRPLPGGDDRP
jgi:hypothetical protein